MWNDHSFVVYFELLLWQNKSWNSWDEHDFLYCNTAESNLTVLASNLEEKKLKFLKG